MKQDTKLIALGRAPVRAQGPVNLPVHRASTILSENLDGYVHRFDGDNRFNNVIYGSTGTQNSRALAEAVAAVESGHRTVVTGSGLSAVTMAVSAVVRAGDHVLVPDSVYGPTRWFCAEILCRYGVETSFYDPAIGAGIAEAMRESTRLVYTEAPGSLTFEMQDVPAIAKAAHERGALVAMDNTWGDTTLLPAPGARRRHLDPGGYEVLCGTFGSGDRDDHHRDRRAVQDDRRSDLCVRRFRLPRRLLSRAAWHAQPVGAPGTPIRIGDEGRPLARSALRGEAGALSGIGERPRPCAVEAGFRRRVEPVRTRDAHHRRGGGRAHGEPDSTCFGSAPPGADTRASWPTIECRSPAPSFPGRKRRSCCGCTSGSRIPTISSPTSRRALVGSILEP